MSAKPKPYPNGHSVRLHQLALDGGAHLVVFRRKDGAQVGIAVFDGRDIDDSITQLIAAVDENRWRRLLPEPR